MTRGEMRSESGSALVELAIMLPVMVLLFAGVVDYGLELAQGMKVQEAASAGTAWGTLDGNSKNTFGMQVAATQAAGGLNGFSVTATYYWSCTPGGTQIMSSVTCNGYGTPRQYIQVATSAMMPTLISFPGMPSSLLLHGKSIMRVPWRP